MDRSKHVGQALEPRRVAAFAVAEQRVDVGLVERHPMLDAVAQPFRNDARVVGEFLRDVTIEPAALLLQRLRQVPMVEAQPRRNAARDQFIDQTIVEIETARLDRAAAGGKNARPRGREPIGVEAAARQQRDVLAPAMIMVAGDVAVVAAFDAAGRVAEDVPDALAAPVGIDRAFDLVARRRGAPDEIGRKAVILSHGDLRPKPTQQSRETARRQH